MTEIDSNQDILDSRDIIDRYEELEERNNFWRLPKSEREEDSDASAYYDGPLDGSEAEELAELERVIQQGAYFQDWEYGVTLVRDTYFTDYAEELAREFGYLGEAGDDNPIYNCIDWDRWGEMVQQDYSDIEFDGVTYWVR